MNNLEERFGVWLKMVLPNSGIAERDSRLGVINEFVATVNNEDILDLVFAFFTKATEQPTVERLRSAMRVVDTSFGPKDDAELAVIAAGALFTIVEQRCQLATTAALAILCADFGALTETDHIIEVVTKARQFVAAEGVRIREESVELTNLREALQSALESKEEGDNAQIPDAEKRAAKSEASLRRVVNVLADYGDKVEQSLASIEARRSEQSDILYWLLSGRRQIEGVPLNGIKKEQAVLFIAVELANLTRQIPGPASVSAILSTLLDRCRNSSANEMTLEGCVQSIAAADGAQYLAKREVVHPVVSPISYALAKAEETGWGDGWQSAFKAQTLTSASTKYPALKIAEQLYREILLSRALREK
jgi:hypothetical protein